MSAVYKFDHAPEPYARLETIGPERAAYILEHNNHNRPVVRSNLARLCRDLKAGEWKLNGETIVLASDGELMTGQHRLKAVVLTGIPIKTFVVYGIDRSAFPTMDQGTPKSVSAILAIDGGKNTTMTAAVARNYMAVYSGPLVLYSAFTPTDAMNVLKAHPAINTWVATCSNQKGARKIFTSSSLAAVVAASEKYGDDLVMEFFQKASVGENLTVHEPAYMFRERMLGRSRSGQMRPAHLLALTIKALRAHCTGKRLGVLRFKEDEVWPEL